MTAIKSGDADVINAIWPHRSYLNLDHANKVTTRIGQDVRKRTLVNARPAKLHISLRTVWSESSPGAWGIIKDEHFLHLDEENAYQTAQIRRLI